MRKKLRKRSSKDEENISKVDDEILPDDNEEFNTKYELKDVAKVLFIVLSLGFILWMVFHRQSRPQELYTTFGVFDEHLKDYQEAVDSLFETRTNDKNDSMGIEKDDSQKEARRNDQKYMLELIRLRLEHEKMQKKKPKTFKESVLKFEDCQNFWKDRNSLLETEISRLQAEKTKLAKEYDDLIILKRSFDSPIESASAKIDSLVKQVQEISSNDMDSLFMEKFDQEAKEIIKIIFYSSVLKSFDQNLSERSEWMKKVIEAIGEVEAKVRVENYFLRQMSTDWLTASHAEEIIKLKLKVKNISPNIRSKWNPFKLERIIDMENDVDNQTHMTALHALEASLFQVSASNWDLRNRISRMNNHLLFSQKFLDVSSAMRKSKDASLRKRAELIVKKQDEMNQKSSSSSNDINYMLVLSWHKRKIYEILTTTRNIFVDPQKLFHLDLISTFAKSHLSWIKEAKKSANKFSVDQMANLLDANSFCGFTVKSFDLEIKIVLIDELKHLRALNHLRKIITSGSFSISFEKLMPDGMIFALSLIFGEFKRLDDKTTKTLLEQWPSVLRKLKDNYAEAAAKYYGKAKKLVSDIIDQTPETVKDTFKATTTKIDNVRNGLNPLVDNVRDKVNPLIENIRDKVNPLIDNVSDKVNPLIDGVRDKVNPLIDNVRSDAKQVIDNVRHIENQMKDTVVNAAAPVVNNVRKIYSKILE